LLNHGAHSGVCKLLGPLAVTESTNHASVHDQRQPDYTHLSYHYK